MPIIEKSVYLNKDAPLGWPFTLRQWCDYLEKENKPAITWEEFKAISTKQNKIDNEMDESLPRKIWMTRNGEMLHPHADSVLKAEQLLVNPQWK